VSEIPAKNRKIVRDRQNDQCARCGMTGAEMHHRQRRREAGHAVGILVWLCSTDHRWAHAHPKDAKADGYIISPHEKDATAVPIRTFGGWALFNDLGDVIYI
jgi:hypothetical protein